MANRTAEERQREIVRVARATGSVDVSALAAELGVARETVRRDLRALEDHGLVRRTHGGAYPVESAGFETTLAFRATSHVPEKRRVAARRGRAGRGRRDGLRRRGLHPAAHRRGPARRPAAHRGHRLPAGSGRARAERQRVRAAARRPRPVRDARHRGPLDDEDALRVRHRPGVHRRQRDLPRTRPDHARPGGQRGQGAGGAGRPPCGVRRRPHQVRSGQLLPVRRGRRAGGDRDEHPAPGLGGPPLLPCSGLKSYGCNPPARYRTAHRFHVPTGPNHAR